MWRKPRWLTDLLTFGRVATRHPLPKPKLKALWRLMGTESDDLSTLRELASLSEHLEQLRDQPGWASLLLLKDQLQAVSNETARKRPTPGDDEHADRLRLIAAAEWWALEALFVTMNRVITQGQKARRVLTRMIAEKV